MIKHEKKIKHHELSVSFLSKETWKDLEMLFGEKGACGGCWCMTPRLSSAEYNLNKGEPNKSMLHDLVLKDSPLGVLAYDRGAVIAWCSISPKTDLLEKKQARIMGHTLVEGNWSIVCLFIKKEYRRKGISSYIIHKAVEYAFRNGATTVEAYPLVTKNEKMPDVFAWHGISKSFQKAGFYVVKQLSKTKLIMQIQKE